MLLGDMSVMQFLAVGRNIGLKTQLVQTKSIEYRALRKLREKGKRRNLFYSVFFGGEGKIHRETSGEWYRGSGNGVMCES